MLAASGHKWELYEEYGFYFLRIHMHDVYAGVTVAERFIQIPIGTRSVNTGANIANIILRHLPKEEGK